MGTRAASDARLRWIRALRSADGMFVTDERQRIVHWSDSAEELLGRPAAEVVGRPCYEVMAGAEPNGHPVCRRGCRAVQNAIRGRVTSDYELVARGGAGDRVPLSNSLVLVDDEVRGSSPWLLHVFRVQGTSQAPPRLPEAAAPSEDVTPIGEPLSRREFEVLRLLAARRTTAQIAAALGISRLTARNHINRLERKLGASSRLEAVMLAAHHHLL